MRHRRSVVSVRAFRILNKEKANVMVRREIIYKQEVNSEMAPAGCSQTLIEPTRFLEH